MFSPFSGINQKPVFGSSSDTVTIPELRHGRLKLYTVTASDGNNDPVYIEYNTTSLTDPAEYFDLIETSRCAGQFLSCFKHFSAI